MLKKSNWPWLIILLVSGVLLAFSLNKDLFMDWDECLYSVYTKEMAKTGNFLINQWNGYFLRGLLPGQIPFSLKIPLPPAERAQSCLAWIEFAARGYCARADDC